MSMRNGWIAGSAGIFSPCWFRSWSFSRASRISAAHGHTSMVVEPSTRRDDAELAAGAVRSVFTAERGISVRYIR
jgi:hypothetical protein